MAKVLTTCHKAQTCKCLLELVKVTENIGCIFNFPHVLKYMESSCQSDVFWRRSKCLHYK